MAVRTAYAGAAVAAEVLTAAKVNRLPGGWIGYVEATVAQTLIGATPTDLTSLTVTVTVGTSRRIQVSSFLNILQVSATGEPQAKIMEGATQLKRAYQTSVVGSLVLAPSVILTPTAGAHTYKVQGLTPSGTISVNAQTDDPSYLLVEDLGPSA